MFKKLILISALLITGCDSEDSTQPEEVSDWKNNNISSYSFNYVTGGFAPSIGVWRIQVHDDEVIHTQFVEAGNFEGELTIESAPTIDDLILRVENCEESKSCEVTTLNLDETYHFPSQVYFSYGLEGDGFSVSEFEVQ
jgi:hypothetical protein